MAVLALILFVVMFLIVFVARSIMQKRATGDTGIRAGVLEADPGSASWFAGWLLLTATLALLAAPIAELAGLDPLTARGSVRGLGLIIGVVGIVLTSLAQVSMGNEWRVGIDTTERTELVTGGAFQLARNPIFTAMIIAAAGLALMVPNPISIGGFVMFVASIQLQVRFVEEPYLQEMHGQAYADYCASVGRFLPGIGYR